MDICRACMSTDAPMLTFNKTMLDDYNTLTDLNIKLLDGMPQHLCQLCSDTISSFVVFRSMCISSEMKLQDFKGQKVKYEHNQKDGIFPDSNIVLKKEEVIKEEVIYNEENLSYHFEEDIESIKEEIDIEDTIEKTRRNGHRKKVVASKNKRNIKQEIKNKEWICGLCPKILSDKEELKEHLETHKNDESCGTCFIGFVNWPQLLGHRAEHVAADQVWCHICDKRYKSYVYLVNHYMTRHFDGETTKPLCYLCNKCYDSPKRLDQHVWSSHKEKKYICDVCSKGFQSLFTLTKHIASHQKLRQYVCDLCGFSCNFKTGLRSHQMRRHNEAKVICKKCKIVFINQEKHDKHTCKAIPHVCPVCGKIIKSRASSFRRHMRTHSDECRYACDECPAKFKARASLVSHKARHDGVPTNQCTYCPAKFYYTSALIKHVRTHTGEKPYVCKVCGKGFTGGNNLKVHMKVHGEQLVVKRDKPVAPPAD